MTQTLPELLAGRVRATPEAPAFHERDAAGRWQPCTWRQFGADVQQLRRSLQAAGLRHGDRVALVAPVSLRWETVHHAALAAGAAIVGLDAHDLPQRIAEMADQADVSAFVVADPAVLREVAAERLAAARFVLVLEPGASTPPEPMRLLDWNALLALDAPAGEGAAGVRADDLATVIFTSGTTGRPRGIAYTHGQVCLATAAICAQFAFVGASSRLLCWLPLSNLFQRIVNLAAVQQGACTHLLADPRQVMQAVPDVEPDIFIAVPRFFEKLHEGVRAAIEAQPGWRRRMAHWAWDIGRRRSRLLLQHRRLPAGLRLQHALAERLVLRRVRSVMGSRLQLMVSGSAPLGEHLLHELHALGWLVLEAYGLSENIVPMAMNRVDDFCFGSVGRPVEGNEIVLGEGGAVKVRGPGLFRGYLGDAGAPVTDEEGFYVTGDIGAWDEHGHLRLIGRSNELFKTSTGRRISPVQVEAALREVPGVDQAVLVGAGRKFPVALCTLLPQALEAGVRQRLAGQLTERVGLLPEHERPRAVGLLEQPFSIERGELTPNLKLRRAAIESLHAQRIASLYRRVDEQSARGDGLLVE